MYRKSKREGGQAEEKEGGKEGGKEGVYRKGWKGGKDRVKVGEIEF